MESAQIWQMLSLALEVTPEKVAVWSSHPLGKKLTLNAINHFAERRDAQQVALVAALILQKEIELHGRHQK